MSEEELKQMSGDELIGIIKAQRFEIKEKDLLIQELRDTIDNQREEIDRLNNIISQIETLIINHNCDTGDIYYKYNGKYLKSELKERIIELVELKENNKDV